MRRFYLAGLVLVMLTALVGFNLSTVHIASAQARAVAVRVTDDCVHAPTIDSLEACVMHARAQGFINNQRVEQSLLTKLDAAEEAVEHGQIGSAIHRLNAFIHEVHAQAGKHIVPIHAMHLVMHAQLVIQALKG